MTEMVQQNLSNNKSLGEDDLPKSYPGRRQRCKRVPRREKQGRGREQTGARGDMIE